MDHSPAVGGASVGAAEGGSCWLCSGSHCPRGALSRAIRKGVGALLLEIGKGVSGRRCLAGSGVGAKAAASVVSAAVRTCSWKPPAACHSFTNHAGGPNATSAAEARRMPALKKLAPARIGSSRACVWHGLGAHQQSSMTSSPRAMRHARVAIPAARLSALVQAPAVAKSSPAAVPMLSRGCSGWDRAAPKHSITAERRRAHCSQSGHCLQALWNVALKGLPKHDRRSARTLW